jgi:enamine deaminase RidA (YjgF/YER057c/UK114 family)
VALRASLTDVGINATVFACERGEVIMSAKAETRLKELGIVLPAATPPWANYRSFVLSGQQVYVSGQLPQLGEESYKGKLGLDLGVEEGQRAARICAINILPHLREACGGSLDRVTQCVEIGGFVNSAPDFRDQPLVLNGASELLVQVFGEIGRHTRFAIGVSALPFNFALEVKGVFEISP